MARLILGGYSSDVVVQMDDGLGRALQAAVVTRLATGNGLFLRCDTTVNEESLVTVSWISPSSSIRFEWDTELPPDLHERLLNLARSFASDIASKGGIVLPGNAEMERMKAEQASFMESVSQDPTAKKRHWVSCQKMHSRVRILAEDFPPDRAQVLRTGAVLLNVPFAVVNAAYIAAGDPRPVPVPTVIEPGNEDVRRVPAAGPGSDSVPSFVLNMATVFEDFLTTALQ